MGRRRVSEEHKRERKRAENKRREMTRIHLGTCFPQWAELKSLRKDNNVELADHLLKVHEHYCKSCRNDAFMSASQSTPMRKRHGDMEVGKPEVSSISTDHFDGELKTGIISRVEDLHSSYDSRQDEVSSRESLSSRSVKVVNQNGQVYVTLGRDRQKSGTGKSQQQQQQQQQIPVLVSSQPSMNSYQQNVLVHSPFVNKPQTTTSDLKISQQPAFMNQIPSGYIIGEVPPKHMNNEIGRQVLSNSSQDSSGVQNPVSVHTGQRTSLTKDNPQDHPDKGAALQGNLHHVGRESGSGKHQVLVEKQIEVKEEPVDDFVVIINPDDDDDDDDDEEEDEYDGETTDTCEESELISEPHDKEIDLVEVKEEPIDDYPDHAGHPQEGSVECHRRLQTAATVTNGTQHQPGNSRMCLPDGNPFSSSNTNTSPNLQEAIIEVVTCYRYGDLVNRHLTSSSNSVKDKQLMSCDDLLKQIPKTGTHVTQTEQGQMGTVDQENLRKRKHVQEEQEQTQKKTKHNG